jgi:hypothetical protein
MALGELVEDHQFGWPLLLAEARTTSEHFAPTRQGVVARTS